MNRRNRTIANEFILLGFSKDLKINIILFILFLIIYLITFFGNGLIICIIFTNRKLHTPMYYFISYLALIDLCYSSSTLPRMLLDLFSRYRTISYNACLTQLYISLFLGESEFLLLAVMAFDRYIAICRPLHYHNFMSWRLCHWLAALPWLGSFVISFLPSFRKPAILCYPNQINHFMCEAIAVLVLQCDSVHEQELLVFCMSFISLLLPFVFIIGTYVCIICSVVNICSVGRSKAFSTCSSHVIVVALFYGTAMIIYFGASSQYSSNQGKYISLFYVIIIPMINPLIYSLKNKEVITSIFLMKKIVS